jgi:sialic acid synthase SpsE
LRTIAYLREQFPELAIGYSDHTDGIESAVLAAALGARIIEEHFTLDKQFSDFRDHQLSSDPMDLTRLVTQVRAAEKMLGQHGKTVQASEAGAIPAVRRSIVATHDLDEGRVITTDDITWVRPGGGLAPGEEDKLLGKVVRRSIAAGEQLLEEDVVPASEAARIRS